MFNQNRLKRLSAALFFLSLIMLVIHIEAMVRFNRHVTHVHGNDGTESARMEIDARADSTSNWLKRDFELDDGRVVDLTGQTIDGTLLNQSGDAIQDWTLQINIVGDCYIKLEFVDTDTLAQRLEKRNSVACEFRSRQFGWCAFRFFAMDRVEGKPLENVIFAVQNINEEKKEQEAALHQIEEAESINRAKAAFVENITDDLQKPMQKLVALNDRILRETREDAIRGYARGAHSAANRLLMLTDGLVDSIGIQSGRMRPASAAYSLRQLLTDTLRIVLPLAEENRFTVALDAAEALPDALQGDAGLIREVLVNLISGIIPQAADGRLQLAVYGKALEGRVHLLFSVRALSDSANEGTVSGLCAEIASTLLNGMGSELKTVRAPAGRSEVYFEIEQKALDDAPIGRIAVEDV